MFKMIGVALILVAGPAMAQQTPQPPPELVRAFQFAMVMCQPVNPFAPHVPVAECAREAMHTCIVMGERVGTKRFAQCLILATE